MPLATMTAAYVRALGPASEIRVGPLPVPTPGPTDVLVAVEAVAVNPVDTYIRSGSYRTPVPLPFIVGRDLVGTVAAVGSDALPFRPGDRVWCNSIGHDGRQGSFAEYALVPAERLYPLPAGVDPETGARVLVTAAAVEPAVPLRQLYTRDASLLGFVISRASVADLATAAALINRMLAERRLTARIAGRLPLSDTALAHQRIEAGTVSGRLLLHP